MAYVLVVDDDPVALQVASDLIRAAGHFVQVAKDWSTMNSELFKQEYAAVVLDVNMPGLAGDRLAVIMQRSMVPKRPKIILHSGLAEAELRRLARVVKAESFVVKGADPVQFVRVVEAAIAAYQRDFPPATPKLV